MKQRNRKRLLLAVNAIFVIALVLAGVAALLPLREGAQRSPSLDEHAPVAVKMANKRVEPLSAYAVIYRRDLVRPLFEAKPAKARKSSNSLPMPKLRLMGTVVEPGFSYAVFQTTLGQTQLVSVGETIQGAEVVSVTEELVTLKFLGRVVTFAVKKQRRGQ